MTVDLKIKVENGAVTITVGGQSAAPAASTKAKVDSVTAKEEDKALSGVAKEENKPEPVVTGKVLGQQTVGSAADAASTNTGGAPPSGSGALVIGPIILNGLISGSGSPKPGSAADAASTNTGSGPAQGSGVIVVGPIVIGGSVAGETVKAGSPVSVTAAVPSDENVTT
jgi:hypothetical protein